MPKIHPPSAALNRLRAAVALVPIIESGLGDGKIDRERAALMAEFCGWAANHGLNADAEASKLEGELNRGLDRLKTLLA
jgi:hypothetical protein